MCRKCYVPNHAISVEVPGRFGRESVKVRCLPGFSMWQSISAKDFFEKEYVFEYVLGKIGDAGALAQMHAPLHAEDPSFIPDGVSNDFKTFAIALAHLALHQPTRMKAIEQLEVRYHKSVSLAKAQRRQALTSLQTRQALEMDMLSGRGCGRVELELMVHQHVSEVEGLTDFWAKEIAGLLSVQLREYKELVLEIHAEGGARSGAMVGIPPADVSAAALGCVSAAANRDVSSPAMPHVIGVSPPISYCFQRPEIPGTQWRGLQAIAAQTDLTRPARLIRLITLKGDFLSTALAPLVHQDDMNVDPEIVSAPAISSAVVLGFSQGLRMQSNQDAEVLRLMDAAPADCRWPSFQSQIEAIPPNAPLFLTHHSNLANGVKCIFHMSTEDGLESVFRRADALGIVRVFVPEILVPDLRCPSIAPSGCGMGALAAGAARALPNSTANMCLREIVLIRA